MKSLFLILCLGASTVVAQERILDFQSAVSVQTDGSVLVTESIEVKVEGIDIQRGIFRDLITVMKGDDDKKYHHRLSVIEVLKDGAPENYTVEDAGIYSRIRIGNADVLLQKRVYTYTITYTLEHQVRFFGSYDEVYWNVTGNQWKFPIDKASVVITLPEGAVASQHAGYSGPAGTTGCSCVSQMNGDNNIEYVMSSGLNPYEGLTVAVAWQKGLVVEQSPPEVEEVGILTTDFYAPDSNEVMTYGGIGIALVFAYVMVAWLLVGRDPRGGAIIPRYFPPKGFSPAACRYVIRMGFDYKTFSAAIVNMAVKGFLVIDMSHKKINLIKNTDDVTNLTSGEKKIAAKLFSKSDQIELDGKYDPDVMKAADGLSEALETEFKKINFRKNSGWMTPSVLLTIGIIGYIIWWAFMNNQYLFFFLICTLFASIFIFVPLIALFNAARTSSGFKRFFRIVFFLVFITPMAWFIWRMEQQFHFLDSWVLQMLPYPLMIGAPILLNVVFFNLIKAPTVLGRRQMDEIEGLAMFMKVAEKDRLNMLNPPDKTPHLFEQLLPYAIALDVENEWGKQFDELITKAIEQKEYTPQWYVGTHRMFASDLTSSLGSSLSSSLASSSTPPSSSSSGSSGGGSSGGGGGGGGGGGW